MDGWIFWAVAALGAVLTGAGKGGIPVVGALTVPVMSLVMSPVAAAGLMLPVYIVSDWFGLYAYRKDFDRRVLAIVCVAMSFGVVLGWATTRWVPEPWVTVVVGVISVSFALNQLLRHAAVVAPKRAEVAPGLFWGSIAGFTSYVSHTGGPPFQVYTLPLGMKKAVFAGTSTIAFAYVNLLKLPFYWSTGQVNLHSLGTAALLMPVAAGSVYLGVWAVRVLPERLFFRIVTWSLLLIGVHLIWQGLTRALA